MEKSANGTLGGSACRSNAGLARRDVRTPMRDVKVRAQAHVQGGCVLSRACQLASPAGRPIEDAYGVAPPPLSISGWHLLLPSSRINVRQLCPQRRWMSYVLASWVQNIDVCTWDASSLTSCLGFVVISSWLQQDARSRCLSKGCNIPMLGEGMQYPHGR